MDQAGLVLDAKAYLARFTPVLAATATPFVIGLIKAKKPAWKTKYREQWPYVAAVMGVAFNLLGLAVAPDILFASAGEVTQIDPVSSMAASAAVGYFSGLGGSKQRDLKRGRKLCNKSKPRKKKEVKK